MTLQQQCGDEGMSTTLNTGAPWGIYGQLVGPLSCRKPSFCQVVRVGGCPGQSGVGKTSRRRASHRCPHVLQCRLHATAFQLHWLIGPARGSTFLQRPCGSSGVCPAARSALPGVQDHRPSVLISPKSMLTQDGVQPALMLHPARSPSASANKV
jgi:hypothetical protein